MGRFFERAYKKLPWKRRYANGGLLESVKFFFSSFGQFIDFLQKFYLWIISSSHRFLKQTQNVCANFRIHWGSLECTTGWCRLSHLLRVNGRNWPNVPERIISSEINTTARRPPNMRLLFLGEDEKIRPLPKTACFWILPHIVLTRFFVIIEKSYIFTEFLDFFSFVALQKSQCRNINKWLFWTKFYHDISTKMEFHRRWTIGKKWIHTKSKI